MKKWLPLLLCLTILIEPFTFFADRGQVHAQSPGEAKASSRVITLRDLIDHYGKNESWLDQQLASGYSLYQIYRALEAEKSGGNAESWLSKLDHERPVIGDTGVTITVQGAVYQDIGSKGETIAGAAALAETKAFAAADTTVDESAIKHTGLQDDATLYMNSYGEDSISLATGDLRMSSIDLSLPGLIPFDLVRTYDSSRANEQIGVLEEEGTYRNAASIRKEEITSALGRGWRWELPFITTTDSGMRRVYIPSVGTFNLTDSLQLDGYEWNDISIQSDSSVTVHGVMSAYRISILNGYDYFLSGEGDLLQIKDAYGNTIDFKYTAIDGARVLEQIQNNDGNSFSFTYDGPQITVQQTGTDRKVIYQKTVVDGFPVLSKVTDSLNRTTKFIYSIQDSSFNFLPGLVGNPEEHGITHTALLMRMIHPTSAVTDINYEASLKKIGTSATQYVFKVRSRENQYSTTSGEEKLGSVSFDYTGQDLDSYGKSSEWTTTVKKEKSQEVFTLEKIFSEDAQPDFIWLEQHAEAGDNTTFKTDYAYDKSVKRNTPTQVTEWAEQEGTASEKLISSYTYDDNGMMTTGKLSTGQETTYKYQSSSAPYHWKLPSRTEVKVNDTLKRVVEEGYNLQGIETKYTVYNGSGGLVLAQSEFTIDDKGRAKTSTTKDYTNDIVSTYAYDSPYGSHLITSRSVTVHDANSKPEVITEKFSYTPAAQIKTQTDGSGQELSYEYDAGGRLTKTVYRDGTTSTNVYDDFNSRITRTAADGIVTKEQYNPLGLLLEEQTGEAVYKFTYDSEGNIATARDAEGNTVKYTADAFGRPVQTLYPDGTTDTTDYNAAANTITYTDAAGNKTRGKTDLLGRSISTEEFKDGTFVLLEKREYDLDGNVTAIIDGKNQRTQYTYDAIGQISTVTTPDQQITRYQYSKTGNLLSLMYPNTQVISKQYDELGRLIKETDPKRQATTYFYDQRSNLVKQIDRQGRTTEYTYSDEDMLTGIKGPDTSVTYTYDDIGRRKSMTDDHGTTSYNYSDTDGALLNMSYPDGVRIDYENNTQQRIGYTLTDTKGSSLKVHGELDEMNRVIAMDVTVGTGGNALRAASAASPLDHMTFDYTANGFLKSQAFSNGLQTGYEYNSYDLSGMTIKQGGTTQHDFGYSYDNNKNIISRTQNGAVDQYTYDPLNRIKSESGSQEETYNYNANGNRQDNGSQKIYGLKNAEYSYDSQNRLTQVKGEGKEVSYSYNGDGLLYERTEGNTKTRYYYDDEAKLIAEADVSSSSDPKMTYVYVYDLNGQLQSRLDNASGKLQYYQLNGHGDVIGLTDADGKGLNSYTYDIWGGPLTEEETVPNVLRYSGEYWDSTTGLQYLRARWYDPGTARFMGEDSYQGNISDPLSMNLYTYVANNPLKYVDPSGHRYQSNSLAELEYVINEAMKVRSTKSDEYWGFRSYLGSKFAPVFNDANNNRFKYLFGLLTQTSSYKNSAGSASWAKEQLLDAYDEWYSQYLLEAAGSSVAFGIGVGNAKNNGRIGTGCNCFVAGTKVQTDEGEKNIEDIKVGDKVLSKNEETGKVAYKEVTATFNHETDEIYQIHVGDQVIESTYNHPFYVKDKGWTFVKDLKVGDLLVQSDGDTLNIDSIELQNKHVTVYNMTVDEFHTYFVSGLGIWVHNSNCNFSVWNKGSFDNIENSAEYHFKKHGKEVGAGDLAQYLRKAEDFARTAKKGSTKSYVDGAVEGTIRYKKNGKYVDIAPDGTIVSFGKS